ncbi:MAG: hypothetical protein SFV17_10270 [Candidatus Obscuribacter sp.]|nr:hypothetical protein [Candidatus Obscuribacter sp.]
MKFFRAFISRAALAGFATALLPMAVAAQQANSSGGGEPASVSFPLFISLVCIPVGYCFVAISVGCCSRENPEPVVIDIAKLGLVLQTVGLAALLLSQVFAGAAAGG